MKKNDPKKKIYNPNNIDVSGYLGRREFTGNISPEDIYYIQKGIKDNTGKDVTPEFIISQVQIEGGLTGKGRSYNTNPFNIGEYDDGTYASFEDKTKGLDAYVKAMSEDYLIDDVDEDVLLSNFVNKEGNRYASDKEYETKITNQIDFIRNRYNVDKMNDGGRPKVFVPDIGDIYAPTDIEDVDFDYNFSLPRSSRNGLIFDGVKGEFKSFLNDSLPYIGALGNIASASEDLTTAGIGGFVGGGVQGYIASGIPGLLAGGVQGLTNYVGAGYNQALKEQIEKYEEEAKYMNRDIDGLLTASYEEGGFGEYYPVQTEDGEKMSKLDTGNIYDVFADELHKDMDDDLVTDFMTDRMYVFPNKKLLKKDLDSLLGYTIGKYRENGRQTPVKEIRLKDEIGDEKITYAEALEKIKDNRPIEDSLSYLDLITNEENLNGRKLYINSLVELNEERKAKKKDKEEVQKMSLGGFPDPYDFYGDYEYGFRADKPPKGFYSSLYEVDPKEEVYQDGFDYQSSFSDLSDSNDLESADDLDYSFFDDLESEIYGDIDDQYSRNEDFVGEARGKYGDYYDRVRRRNLASYLTSNALLALQSRVNEPVLKSPFGIEEKYRGISNKGIDEMSDSQLGSVAQIVRQVQENGGSSDAVAAAIAPALVGKVLDSSGNARSKALEYNANQRSAKIKELGDIDNFNAASTVTARAKDSQDTNDFLSKLSYVTGEYLKNTNKVDGAELETDLQLQASLNREYDNVNRIKRDLKLQFLRGRMDRDNYDRQIKMWEKRLEMLKNEMSKIVSND